MILITTSRRPSARTRSLCNELAMMIPDSMRINRGKMNNERLLTFASVKGARTLVVIDSQRGNPSAISFDSVQRDHRSSASLKLRIMGVRLQRELTGETKAHPAKKLMVLEGKGDAELVQFTRTLAGFLEGNLVETADYGKLRGELGNGCVVLKTEEEFGEIILKFVDVKSLGNHGPQIIIRRRDFLPNDIGGSLID